MMTQRQTPADDCDRNLRKDNLGLISFLDDVQLSDERLEQCLTRQSRSLPEVTGLVYCNDHMGFTN
jgi:hypothetical protein